MYPDQEWSSYKLGALEGLSSNRDVGDDLRLTKCLLTKGTVRGLLVVGCFTLSIKEPLNSQHLEAISHY